MLFYRYFTLRKQIYTQEIRHWLKQVENLFLVGSIFLGTAIPALFFSILLAYGVIFDKQSSILQTLILVWSLLLSQSLILMLCKSAILGSRFRLYVSSLEINTKHKILSESLLSIVSNPVLLICIFVVLSISPRDWPAVIHGFVVLSMLMIGTYSSIYTSAKMHFSLLVMLILIPVIVGIFSTYSISDTSFYHVYLGFDDIDLAILLLFAFMLVAHISHTMLLRSLPSMTFRLPALINIWMQIFIGDIKDTENTNKPNLLLLVTMASMLITMLCVYAYLKLPEFPNIVMTIGMQFIVLFCACLQLSNNKIIEEHGVFFSQYTHNRRFLYLQFAVPAVLFVVFITILGSLLQTPLVFLSVFAFIICLMSAKNHAKSLVLIWLISCSLSSLLVYLSV